MKLCCATVLSSMNEPLQFTTITIARNENKIQQLKMWVYFLNKIWTKIG